MFTRENTTDYTDAELAKLNTEWAAIVADGDLEPGTDEFHTCQKTFADEVAGRTEAGE